MKKIKELNKGDFFKMKGDTFMRTDTGYMKLGGLILFNDRNEADLDKLVESIDFKPTAEQLSWARGMKNI